VKGTSTRPLGFYSGAGFDRGALKEVAVTFKTILAIVQRTADAERVVGCAAELVSRYEGHLIGLHAEAMPIPYTSSIGFPDAEFIQASTDINKERADKLGVVFRSVAEAAGVSAEWRSFESFSGDSALSGIASARCADLVVVAQADPNADSGGSADIETLLFDAGRPVLVVPHSGACLSSYRRVLVAWDGSRPAARAVFDALPFILEAHDTEILMVDPPDPEPRDEPRAGEDVAAALARHGADVRLHTEMSGALSLDAVIQNRAAATGADLLVLGAYSHSWLREFLFGGVTRSVLQSMPITTFLSR
jgi:nucleotide-binding universal stress UspA family protein